MKQSKLFAPPNVSNVHLLYDSLGVHQNKQIILAADSDLFRGATLEAKECSPCLKKKS